MGFEEKTGGSIDMIRVGIKNFIKISKKCHKINKDTALQLFSEVTVKLTLQIA